MIKPIELHEYMLSQMTNEQRIDEKLTELLPVIVKGIIKAVDSK